MSLTAMLRTHSPGQSTTELGACPSQDLTLAAHSVPFLLGDVKGTHSVKVISGFSTASSLLLKSEKKAVGRHFDVPHQNFLLDLPSVDDSCLIQFLLGVGKMLFPAPAQSHLPGGMGHSTVGRSGSSSSYNWVLIYLLLVHS